MHPWEQENNLILRRKKKEAEVDIAIDTVSRSIESLDVNIALLKVSIERSPGSDGAQQVLERTDLHSDCNETTYVTYWERSGGDWMHSG
ncbi:hypothetical protein KUCAC02_033091 [Chaenocephalus aceratus]|nr:hypothetical protein KUCAC02_033091 [Chaenocephalus aceratus]